VSSEPRACALPLDSQFTTPGIEGAHEKHGVEGEIGRYRRSHLVSVPAVSDLTQLNALILAGYQTDLLQRIVGRPETVAEASSQSSSATAEESIRNREEMSPTFYRPSWRLSSR